MTHESAADGTPHDHDPDRRSLLKAAAAAGAVGWVAPVVLTSSPAAAAVFTAKCAPTAVSVSTSFEQTVCDGAGTILTISLALSGRCPCGTGTQWCAQKTSPAPPQASNSANASFPGVFVPFAGSTNVSGSLALGCTDRDGDTRFDVYDWSLTAFDDGGPCSGANSLSAVSLTGPTTVDTGSCPPLDSVDVAPGPSRADAPINVRPPG